MRMRMMKEVIELGRFHPFAMAVARVPLETEVASVDLANPHFDQNTDSHVELAFRQMPGQAEQVTVCR